MPDHGEAMRHASREADSPDALCGSAINGERVTEPHEQVNCPVCRVILNHVRRTYPEHARYGDWRLTPAQERKAARDMAADMYGGSDD